jgi:CBS domain-containing protein
MITAKDVMSPWVVTATREISIKKAIDLMLEYKVSGLPVVDDEGALVGIITEKDVLQLYNTFTPLENITVEKLMTTPVIYFDEDESLDNIWQCLLQKDFRRVPVTSSGKVVGIISRPDITRSILEKMRCISPVGAL